MATPTHKLNLAGAQETLLIPLYARALDSRSRHPILGDRKADEIVRSIDYDFEKLKGLGAQTVLVARAKRLDDWTREFIMSAPDAVVLNLGCGLDSRADRISPASRVAWYDFDYPAVIEQRRKFFSEREGYTMVGASLTEPGLLDGVPRGRPAMVIADGVFEYIAEGDVRALLNTVTGSFPRGQVAFDVMSSFAVKSGRAGLRSKTGAEMKWSVDDLRSVDALDPKLRRTSELSLFASKDLPASQRVAFGALSLSRRFREMVRLLRYEFGPA